MQTIRTPDHRFENLAGYPFAPHYTEIDDGEGGKLRVHHIDEGPADGEVILCLHGNPSWSYLYRNMIPVFVDAGFRVIAPDLVGFGRSDKPTLMSDHAYNRHVRWMSDWIEGLDLTCNLFCQDWGGLIGLRIVSESPERFRRVVVGNTSLPDGGRMQVSKAEEMRATYEALPVVPTGELVKRFLSRDGAPGYWYWRKYAAESPEFTVAAALAGDPGGSTPEVLAAQEAPYPDDRYMAALRGFPTMAPIFPDDPELEANRAAWARLATFERPFRTSFSDNDYVARPGDESSFRERIPGAKNVDHVTLKGGGHFLQSPEVAEEMISFIRRYPVDE